MAPRESSYIDFRWYRGCRSVVRHAWLAGLDPADEVQPLGTPALSTIADDSSPDILSIVAVT